MSVFAAGRGLLTTLTRSLTQGTFSVSGRASYKCHLFFVRMTCTVSALPRCASITRSTVCACRSLSQRPTKKRGGDEA